MADWTWYAIGAAGGLVVLIVLVLIARRLWRRRVRRYVSVVMGRRTAVASGLKSLVGLMSTLADGDTAIWLDVVSPDSEMHCELRELMGRMKLVAKDLSETPLPKSVWPHVEMLEKVAERVVAEAGRVVDADTPETLIAAVEGLDLIGVADEFAQVSDTLEGVFVQYGVKDSVIYGGGLYI